MAILARKIQFELFPGKFGLERVCGVLGPIKALNLNFYNFRDLGKDVWIGLDNLKELDVGWNELKELQPQSFAPLDKQLTSLNLRHNPLTTVDFNFFRL